VRRAAEVAFHARQYESALEAISIWLSIEPGSQQAKQMQSPPCCWLADASTSWRPASGATWRRRGPRATGDALLQLSRAFTRYPDRAGD
jgi:hypothetical protein